MSDPSDRATLVRGAVLSALLVLPSLPASAAPATRPASAPAAVAHLQDPAFWINRTRAEWANVTRAERRPWRALAAAQATSGDRKGLVQTLTSAGELLKTASGQPGAAGEVTRVYASLVPFFAELGDEAGLRHAIAVAIPVPQGATSTDGNRGWVAELLAKAGRDAEALEVASAIAEPRERARVATGLATLAAAGNRKDAAAGAFAVAAPAAEAAEKAVGSGLESLANGYVAAGDEAQALAVADRLSDHVRARVLARAAVFHARAGREADAAGQLKTALELLGEANWAHMDSARAVAQAAAEANDPAAIAAVIKLANRAKATPAGPNNDPTPPPPMVKFKGRPARPSEVFAWGCFAGLAEGAAARGDAAAAQKHLAGVERVNRATGATSTFRGFQAVDLPVAERLAKAGRALEAAALMSTSPHTAKPPLKERGDDVEQHLWTLAMSRCAEIYAQAGDFRRAAMLVEQASGQRPPPWMFADARAKQGDLDRLLREIEASPSPEVRCLTYAAVAEALANKNAPPAAPRSAPG